MDQKNLLSFVVKLEQELYETGARVNIVRALLERALSCDDNSKAELYIDEALVRLDEVRDSLT